MDELTKMLLGLFIVSVLDYYGSVIVNFYFDDYEYKREFILDLIPFRAWYKGLKKRWNKLK